MNPDPERSEFERWNERYATRDTPWDSGEPSRELQRILAEEWFPIGRVLELGCGTGTNAIYLATLGFEVTATDLSPLAIERAKEKAGQAGVAVRFEQADVLTLPDLGPPFPFVFDRGLYHAMRRADLAGFLGALARVVEPGGHYLTLAGNANDPEPSEGGPPRVHAQELCGELAPLFDLVQLREFRFDGVVSNGRALSPLAWSGLFRGRGGA